MMGLCQNFCRVFGKLLGIAVGPWCDRVKGEAVQQNMNYVRKF